MIYGFRAHTHARECVLTVFISDFTNPTYFRGGIMNDDAPDLDASAKALAKMLKLQDELKQALYNFKVTESLFAEALTKATDSGYELGWIAGVLACSAHLDAKGYLRVAAELKTLIKNNPLALPSIGDA